MFSAIARLSTARPWAVLLFAATFLVNALVFGSGVADRLGNGGTDDPAAESTEAARLLDQHFPTSRSNLVLLVRAADGRTVDDRTIAQQGAQLTERLAFEPSLVGVTSYWQTGVADLKSRDGRYALVLARVQGDETAAAAVFDVIAPRYRGQTGDLVVRLGGATAVRDQVQSTIQEDIVRSELIALPLTLLILVWVFGSLVAALLPLAVGIVAILGTGGVLGLLSRATDVSIFAQNLTTALGLGLAIDYALFIVRRFREEQQAGADVRAAVTRTLATAGRTVLFSALTVAVSLAAMLIFPMYFLRSFAYAGISVVLLAAAAALLLLPALLVILGPRVDALDLRRLLRRRRAGTADRVAGQRWYGTATAVMRRAPVVTLLVTGVLVLLGLPFLRVEFGTTDDRQLPRGTEARAVQDTIRENFALRPTAVIDVVLAERTEPEALGDYAARLSALPTVAQVESPQGTYRGGARADAAGPADALRTDGGVAHLSVTPTADIEDISPESQALVRDLRAVAAPVPARVGGQAAALVDTRAAIGDRLPLAIGLIAATTFLLVFLMTGSVLIPLQALVLNALSLTAMFGAVVWIFQDGNGAGLLGFTQTGYIETSLPVLMFCVAFGLSMDYGVFLLSRIREEYERTGDNRSAIAFGIQRTGSLITAAAVILALVLAIIGTSRITNIKMLGLGVALAVLVDATVVRCLLVPAVMALTGRATWWAPSWLRRVHRRVGLREDGPAAAPPTTPARTPVAVAAGADDSTLTDPVAR
ncbi:MMPL family transporter [Micromonospora sp. NPDC023888]|uniref:MMPL family transporter n=1 Tax=Micromonospora sp. NPDC023888 TaxID=3155607 RepID=UPI00340B211F